MTILFQVNRSIGAFRRRGVALGVVSCLPRAVRRFSSAAVVLASICWLLAAHIVAQTPGTGSAGIWQPVGPASVSTTGYGLVTGRVSAVAFDPSDPTGNRVYLGATGGGVWLSQNAATSNTSNVQFTPRTDIVGALTGARDPSITIGAISVQPGGTGVVLAGTGDPNDAVDSYYGAGILRSTDGGNTWSVIQATSDHIWAFTGEAFSGFAWSTVNPQLVVAAVSQSYEGLVSNALWANASYEGLYYSTDSGATWSLSRITDGGYSDVQGPQASFALPDGNAATSVVWNPVRKVFFAAVRAHGYYQSTDGVTWTRLTAQPGSGLTSANCPTDSGSSGSISCPIFRGTLAVNPATGDTFAWTADLHNQDRGLWEDSCGLVAGICSNQTVSFGTRWTTTDLDVNDPQWGPATVEGADYTLSLAAIPSGQDTVLLAGIDDVWKCSLAAGCKWRNTTNVRACKSAQVGPYQHALVWNANNPLEILIGNDGGLWRSLDGIAEAAPACDVSDASHFQNLNAGLGSLAEVQSLATSSSSADTLMIGLGVNGTTGASRSSSPASSWPQVLGGYGGPLAIDPTNASNWYVNNQAGVSIRLCAQGDSCTSADFAATVVTSADVGGDGDTMPSPAPFLVDPLDPSQLLIGTCRVWRGPSSGAGWTSTNAVSPFFDGQHKSACNGDPLIRSMAAQALADGTEVVYVGMYGFLNEGGTLPGHVFTARVNPASNTPPVWTDLTSNPVTNATTGMNSYGYDVSSIVIDPHDPTGNTVYVTVEGTPQLASRVRMLLRSTDGGATWLSMMSNLPSSAGNAVAIDPLDANTVYVALDAGVFSTRRIGQCTSLANACWSVYGSGLPQSPITRLVAAGTYLVAGTYGRGVWKIPLWTTGTQLTSATADPAALTFPVQSRGTASTAQTVALNNTGSTPLTIQSIGTTGDFAETDNCQNLAIPAGGSCEIQVVFAPTQDGTRSGQLAIAGNIMDGPLIVSLSGSSTDPTGVTLNPSTINFGLVAVGTASTALQVTAENPTSTAVAMTSLAVTGPFVVSSNGCGNSLAANSDCQFLIEFVPTQGGQASGTLTLVDAAGTQTVALSGTGSTPPTDTLSSSALTFPAAVVGQISQTQNISMTNSGGQALTSISTSTSGPFQVSSTCGGQLSPNSTCTFSVAFDPTTTGTQTGVLTIADALRTQTVSLNGTGLAPPQINVSPAGLSFPAQAIGGPSAPLVLTISNRGGAALMNVGFQFAGPSSASFGTGTSTCGANLGVGASCTVQVIFTPTIAGGVSATLAVSSSQLGVKALQVPLTGIGEAVNGLNVSPAALTFTQGTIGQASDAQTVTLSNASSLSADALTFAVNSPFNLAENTCGSALAAGATCTVGVVFTPTTNGAVAGALTVASSTLNLAQVLLNGIGGVAGSIQMQPALLNFSTIGIGATSPTQTVTLTNNGPVDLPGLSLRASSGFQLASTTCAATLPTGASCHATIAFEPANAGQQTGSLTATSTALATPTQAVLSGMGFDFALALSGSANATISKGQTANFMLVLQPMNGSSGTFSFACGSVPSIGPCSFNPSSEVVGAGTSGNVMVQIATAQTASAVRRSGDRPWSRAIVLCGLFLLPFAIRRKAGSLWIGIALLVFVSGLVSCAGSGGGAATSSGELGNSSPTAGTYSIPVTATANGVTHTVTFTLTVD